MPLLLVGMKGIPPLYDVYRKKSLSDVMTSRNRARRAAETAGWLAVAACSSSALSGPALDGHVQRHLYPQCSIIGGILR